MTGGGQQEHCTNTGEEGDTEICEQIQRNLSEQDSMAEDQNDPQGPFFYQERGKTYASLPLGMIQGIQQSPLFKKMQKDCKAEGIELLKKLWQKTQGLMF